MIGGDVRSGALAALAALALAFAVGACGGSDDDDGGRGGSGSAPAGAVADDKRAVRDVMVEMGSRVSDGNYRGACELMATDSRAEIAAGAGDAGGGDPVRACATVLSESLGGGNVAEDLDPPIVKVAIDGDRAVVTARPSHDDGLQRARLRREEGEWRVETFYTN